MRILLLAESNSTHTQKWAKSLALQGLEINLFSLSHPKPGVYDNIPNLHIYSGDIDPSSLKKGIFAKLSYLGVLSKLKKIIHEIKPDIVHAHYATSYGLLGVLSGFHPLIISVWGSDVFDFPNKSILHRTLLQFNLSKADKVLSTSNVMAKETSKYTNKQIEVTPFGIDTDFFKKGPGTNLFNDSDLVIGTIKSLEKVYGITFLIQAFKILKDKYPAMPLKLLITGGGSQELELKDLVKKLGVENDTIFTGSIPFNDLSGYYNTLSVYVALSERESFGVAVIEAGACEKPVVVSDVGGLPEVVVNNITGLIVPPADPLRAAEAIEKLILDENLRDIMGKTARKRVIETYNWNDNVAQMIKIYRDLIK